MNKPCGIIIFGANGSGKTTLGRELAHMLGFKHLDHEDYAFEQSEIPYTVERSFEEYTKEMLFDIENSRGFVLTSVTGDFGEEIQSLYKLAICLEAPLKLRIERVKQRNLDKFGDRAREGGDLYERQKNFVDFVATRTLSKIEQRASTLTCPIIHMDGTVDYKSNAALISDVYNTRFVSIGLPDFPDQVEAVRRISARGVCIRNGKALMIKYKWPGYGFAGGGIEKGETLEETVAREFQEEIGCTVTKVGKFLLSVTERTTSVIHPGKYFEQVNLYYECEVANAPCTTQTTQEEADREYECIWVDLSEALRENEAIPQRQRDVAVLKLLLGTDVITKP